MKDAWQMYQTAWSLFKARAYEEAMQHINDALHLSPELTRGWFLKGVILEEMGKPEEAEPYFEKVSNLSTRWFILALEAQDAQFDPERNLSYYERVRELNDRNPAMWYNKGCLYQQLGLQEIADECFRRSNRYRR